MTPTLEELQAALKAAKDGYLSRQYFNIYEYALEAAISKMETTTERSSEVNHVPDVGKIVDDNGLKPCPFCGGEAEFERKGNHRYSTIVACVDCGARLENGEEWGHGGGWNTRAEPAQSEVYTRHIIACFIYDGMSLADLADDIAKNYALTKREGV